MSFKRFKQIKMAFRFDDKLAPVRDIIIAFNNALHENYTPGLFLCVNEILIEFHGRVNFSDKAGKIWHQSILVG